MKERRFIELYVTLTNGHRHYFSCGTLTNSNYGVISVRTEYGSVWHYDTDCIREIMVDGNTIKYSKHSSTLN